MHHVLALSYLGARPPPSIQATAKVSWETIVLIKEPAQRPHDLNKNTWIWTSISTWPYQALRKIPENNQQNWWIDETFTAFTFTTVTMLNLKWLMLGNKNVFTVSEQPRACCYLLRAHGTINFTKKTISNFHKLLLWTLSMLTYWCCFDVEIKKIIFV